MADSDRQGVRYNFAECVFDAGALTLVVRGEPVRLEPKPLEVLRCLLEHPGEVVTRDELYEHVWPGRILTDTVLPRAITKLRHALGDEDQELVATVHGYGYRLVAPVKIEQVSRGEEPSALDLEEGQHPPSRANWTLREKLGSGGNAEVWLARHDKTNEARVFKFARNADSLAGLKREITVYRLLSSIDPERKDLVRVLDWNLDEPPFYLELEYQQCGSLLDAADSLLKRCTQDQRLDLLACIADSVASAHAVGVLHKDLKPSNLFVAREGNHWCVKIGDFGSARLTPDAGLTQMGITRLGFTATGDSSSSGTPMYIAPEVAAGQLPTVGSDVYALGVMLFQLAVNDFRATLAPGWESRIEDETLRGDIAAAAHGDPALRLTDAASLARRIRELPERRRQHQLAAEAREQAEESERLRLQFRAARTASVVATVVALIAVAIGVYAWQSRNEAIEARADAEELNEFVTEDVFGGLAKKGGEMTIPDWLAQSGEILDKRFAQRPELAARIDPALIYAMQFGGAAPEAHARLVAAADRIVRDWPGSADYAMPFLKVMLDGDITGRLPRLETMDTWNAIEAYAVTEWGADDRYSLLLQGTLNQARLRFAQVSPHQSEVVASDLLAKARGRDHRDSDLESWLLYLLAQVMQMGGNPERAIPLYEESWALLPEEGDEHRVHRTSMIASLLIQAGRHDEAAEMARSLVEELGVEDYSGNTQESHLLSVATQAEYHLARRGLADMQSVCTKLRKFREAAQATYPAGDENRIRTTMSLNACLAHLQRWEEMLPVAEEAVALVSAHRPAGHPVGHLVRLRLSQAQAGVGRRDEASETLAKIDYEALATDEQREQYAALRAALGSS